jgi:hypothetical protein
METKPIARRAVSFKAVFLKFREDDLRTIRRSCVARLQKHPSAFADTEKSIIRAISRKGMAAMPRKAEWPAVAGAMVRSCGLWTGLEMPLPDPCA